MTAPNKILAHFQDAREEYGPGKKMDEVMNGVILAVGFLIGADLPYAAGAVAHLYELQFPNHPPPWS